VRAAAGIPGLRSAPGAGPEALRSPTPGW
jgi:hypothetical protein